MYSSQRPFQGMSPNGVGSFSTGARRSSPWSGARPPPFLGSSHQRAAPEAEAGPRAWKATRNGIECVFRELARSVDSDVDAEVEDAVAEATGSLIVRGDGSGDGTLVEAMVVARFVEGVALFRRILRSRCVAHDWQRRVPPADVFVGEDYDSCTECSALCCSTQEEREMYADAMGALGRWNSEEVSRRKTVGLDCCTPT